MDTYPVLHACMLWSAAAAGSLVTSTWQGCALAAAIALCLRLLSTQRRLPAPGAAGRSLVWLAVFLLVVLLHVAAFASWPHHAAQAGEASMLHLDPEWGLAIACAWAMLSVHGAARLAWSTVRLRGIAQRATPVSLDPACLAQLGMTRRPVQICTSLDIDRPSVIGFRSPRILLPPGLLAELSAAELEQIVLHELEHLRRGDDWTNLVQKVVLVLFPLNPVLLWIEHRLCSERELACDDGVLRRTRARKAYASCLARLGEYSMLRRGVSLALGAWEKQSELSRRVYRILSQPEAQKSGTAAGVLTSFLVLLLLAGAGGLAHSRPMISFASVEPLVAGQAGPEVLLPRDATMPPAHMSTVSMKMPVAVTGPRHATAARLRNHRQDHARLRTAVARTGPDAVFAQRPLPRKQWLVLANWEPATRHGNLPEPEDFFPAFAALPTANGWLIIEL